MDDTVQRILRARVYDVAIESPLNPAPNLSRRLDNTVLLKREDLQPVFSFKLRGAYNRMAQLGADELQRGVIAASAGNHAQGVALAADRLGCHAVIVMPLTTPAMKVRAVAARGAEVVLHGDTYDEACQQARVLEQERGLTFIHPFDDPEVIAGQGTVGLEILRQCSAPPDAIYVAVGGGGLIAGIAAFIKNVWPEVEVIGVEPVDADAMTRSLAAGRRVSLEQVGLFADGVAVRQVGVHTFELARRYVDAMVTVDTDEICAAIKDVFEDTRSILEPAGALAVAGMKADVQRRGLKRRTLVAVACGANMNFDRLRFVAERAELGEEREAMLAVEIPERPGSLRQLCELLGSRSLTEFSYRMADHRLAHIFLGVQIDGRRDTEALISQLSAGWLPLPRPQRQRTGQAAPASHGGRAPAGGGLPRRGCPASGTALSLRVSRTAWRPDGLRQRPARQLVDQHLPLPQPGGRRGPHRGGGSGGGAGFRGVGPLPLRPGVPPLGRDREPGLSAVPRPRQPAGAGPGLRLPLVSCGTVRPTMGGGEHVQRIPVSAGPA